MAGTAIRIIIIKRPNCRCVIIELIRRYSSRILNTARIVDNNITIRINAVCNHIVARIGIRRIPITVVTAKKHDRTIGIANLTDDFRGRRIPFHRRAYAISVCRILNEIHIRTSFVTVTCLLSKTCKRDRISVICRNVRKNHCHSRRATTGIGHRCRRVRAIRLRIRLRCPTRIVLRIISATIQCIGSNSTTTGCFTATGAAFSLINLINVTIDLIPVNASTRTTICLLFTTDPIHERSTNGVDSILDGISNTIENSRNTYCNPRSKLNSTANKLFETIVFRIRHFSFLESRPSLARISILTQS